MKAQDVIEDTEEEQYLAQSQIRKVADWFHNNQGELFPREEAVEKISDDVELEVPDHLTHKSFISQLIGDLVGDHVDPVQLIQNANAKYVGIIDYDEHSTYYTYDEYHDIEGKYKRGVCAACIHESSKSSEPFSRHTGNFGNSPYGDEDQLAEEIGIHVEAVHSGEDVEVETGATLASGTTIAGNTSFHAGNDGSASGLSADDVDGSEPPFANSDLANSAVTVNTGTYVTGGGSVSLGSSINIDHADTSTQGDVSAAAGAAITDVNLDGNGHITSLGTTDFDSRFDNYQLWRVQDGSSTVNVNSNDALFINGSSQINTSFSSTDSSIVIDIDHADTSNQGDVSAAGGAAITDVNLDTRGHITSLNTTDFDGRFYNNGESIVNVPRVGSNSGNGKFFDFNNDNNFAELVDNGGTRTDLVTNRVFFDSLGGWIDDSPVAGLDADTVDGFEATDLQGGGIWEEDPNSPFTVTADNNFTANLANTYDVLKVFVSIKNNNISNGEFSVRVNGDSNENYVELREDGSTLPSQISWNVLNSTPAFGSFKLTSFFNGVRYDNDFPRADQSAVVGGENLNVSAPISSLEFILANGLADIIVEVYGKNIN